MNKLQHNKDKSMKIIRYISLLMISLFLTIPFSCSNKPDKQVPTIRKGLLDLTDWDFKKDGKLDVTGECRFFWMRALNSVDFDGSDKPESHGYIKIPSTWNDYKINGKKIGPRGYATYHFKVKLDRVPEELSFKFLEISSAYNFFIDDKKITSVGNFATSAKDANPGRLFQVVTFKPERSEFNVIFQISNYRSPFGGFWGEIYMGTPKELHRFKNIQIVTEFFIFGCIFIMFIYHLGFYFFRRKDKSTLFFSLGSLWLAIYLLVSGQNFFCEIFPNLPWSFTLRTIFISAYLSMGMLSYFLYYIFTEEVNIYVVHAGNIICISFVIFTVAASVTAGLFAMTIFSVFIFFWIIYFSIALFSAIRNKSEGALIFILGCVILVGSITNDVIYGLNIIDSAFIAPFGTLGFIFSQAMLISRRFSSAYVSVENLSIDLEQLNTQLLDFNKKLDKKVKERTKELETMNDTLRVMTQDLITADETARNDMEMATNVQASLLPKKLPPIKSWDIAFEFKPMSGVSGDLYDFYITNDLLEGMNICDVSGHGISSGLITMIARSAFHRNFRSFQDSPLNVVMGEINNDLIGEIEDVDNFLTSILLRFNGNTVEYVNAGHTELLRKNGKSGKVEVIDNEECDLKGRCMGVSILSKEYDTMTFNLEKDDVIILYSDCIIESTNSNKEDYNYERLITSVEKVPNISAKEILEIIISDLYNFIGNVELKDDLTVIVMKYLG